MQAESRLLFFIIPFFKFPCKYMHYACKRFRPHKRMFRMLQLNYSTTYCLSRSNVFNNNKDAAVKIKFWFVVKCWNSSCGKTIFLQICDKSEIWSAITLDWNGILVGLLQMRLNAQQPRFSSNGEIRRWVWHSKKKKAFQAEDSLSSVVLPVRLILV